MKILLIAGHCAGDPGACATHNGTRFREADETRTMVQLLAEQLGRFEVDVGVYNTQRNAYADAQAGKFKPACLGYDYVLEIHFNAAGKKSADGRTTGTEIYVTTSERSVGVELQIVDQLRRLGFTNRGVKRSNFSVITQAKACGVSSALLETCFLDDPDDMALYTRDRRAVARAVADGIAAGFALDPRKRTDREIVQQAAGLSDATMTYLAGYKYGADLLRKLADAIGR